MINEKSGSKWNMLFLEGPIQTGKSTLIKSALKKQFPAIKTGGFQSQRLVDENGTTVAFRMGCAGDMPSDDAAEYLQLSEDKYGENGIFKYMSDDGRMHVTERFFEIYGVRILKDCLLERPELILLDEIGGHEMDCDEYRDMLYEVLSSGIPCIGVIKSVSNTEKMMKKSPLKAERIIRFNGELHGRIEKEFNGKILWFDRKEKPEDADRVKQKVEEFLDSVIGESGREI